MTDIADPKTLIREMQENVAKYGRENTTTYLMVQAITALQQQNRELEAVSAGGVQALSAAPAVPGPQEATFFDPIQAAADAASVGHLSRLLDHQSALLAGAMQSMRAIELAASPINESQGDFDARIPYNEWASFVESRAALLHDFAQSPVASPTPPAEQQDLSKLTERGAVAWAGVDAQTLRDGTYQQATTTEAVTPKGDATTGAALGVEQAAPKAAPGELNAYPMAGNEDVSDLGPWQSGTDKPSMDGTYLREFDEGEGTSEFHQGAWLRDGFFPSDLQGVRWRGRAAPQQEAQYDHGPQAETVEEAACDVGKWLNERPNRPLDLRNVAMLAHYATAPQQEAQEPVAVIGADFTIFWAGHGPIAPIVERHALKVGSPLYAAPQPAPAELERLKGRVGRIGLDIDRALHGHVNEQSPVGAGRLAAIAALAAKPAPAPMSDDVLRAAAFEAVRKNLCALPRYSFVLDDDGLVRRVQDRAGNWIEFDDAHELFDPVAIDAAIAAQGGKV